MYIVKIGDNMEGNNIENKKRFTLVGLLVVIAILAILVIIAMPSVLKLFNNPKKRYIYNRSKNNI